MNTTTTLAPWYAQLIGKRFTILDSDHMDIFYMSANHSFIIAEANAKLAAQAPILQQIVEKQEE